jgi:hypothetical protein
MVAARDIQLAQEAVRELRAQGQPERAAAIETLLAAATASQHETGGAPPWTVREAARATGIPGTLIRQWISARQLPARIVSGRTLIRPDDFWACVDAIPSAPTSPAPDPTSPEGRARRRHHEALLAALPHDRVARQESLLEKQESGQRLSPSERREMISLEKEIIAAAADVLRRQIRAAQKRNTSHSSAGAD